ncbi:Small nuclear RNA activating complex, polypeptide 1, 43kDa [Mortierella sp. AD031]|nr:Small nuclear RNA activating complex, polypeptide 1, 43kDa [Mortierella sp. AD031]
MDCISLAKSAIFTSALRSDIYGLMKEYKEKESTEYPPFAAIWKDRQFSLIHFACREIQSRDVFIAGLSEIFFQYLSSKETFPVHAGAVYGLYLVYSTQPTNFKKIPIRLTSSAWHFLESVYKQAFERKATDLIYIIRKLRNSNAFVYVAQEEPVSKPLMDNNGYIADQAEKLLIQTENAMQVTSLVPIEPLLSDMSSLAAEYHKAKAGLVSLALARRSSELVMTQLLKAKPAGMNLKEAKPIPQFLTGESTLGAEPRLAARVSPTVAATGSTSATPSAAARTMTAVTGMTPRKAHTDSEMEIDAETTLSSLTSATLQPGELISAHALTMDSTVSAIPDMGALSAGIVGTTAVQIGSTERAKSGLDDDEEEGTSSSEGDSDIGETEGAETGQETEPTVTEQSEAFVEEGQMDADVQATDDVRGRARWKRTQPRLPTAFPLSMLQSTTSNIATQMEDVVRDYYKHRLQRFEYATSGGLTMNDNEYPEDLLLVNRSRKRQLEKERRAGDKQERKHERAKRRHEELAQKLREKLEADGEESEGSSSQIQRQNGESDMVMDGDAEGQQEQDMTVSQVEGEATQLGEGSADVEESRQGERQHDQVASLSTDDVMAESQGGGGGSALNIPGDEGIQAQQGDVDLQAIEGAESLVRLQKLGSL